MAKPMLREYNPEEYKACNEMFRKHLKQEKSVEDAVKQMDIFVAAVNGIIGRGEK